MSGDSKSRRTWGAASKNNDASARFLDCPVAGWCQRNERNYMMNNTNGWMGDWAGGGMWLWTVIGVAVVVLLVVVIGKLSKK
jgi:anti-sigma-K factor RskA